MSQTTPSQSSRLLRARELLRTEVRDGVWSETLEQLVSRLPKRYRTIIIRCDLAGELQRSVAEDLDLSERYFYRLRRRALEALGALLENEATSAVASALGPKPLDPIDARFAAATALHNAGRSAEAIAEMRDVLADSVDAASRAHVLTRIAELTCYLPDLGSAWTNLRFSAMALSEVDQSHGDRPLLIAEVDATAAFVHWRADELQQALACAEKALSQLRGLWHNGESLRVAQALITTLLVAGNALVNTGSLGKALYVALEARDIVERMGLRGTALHVQSILLVARVKELNLGTILSAMPELALGYKTAAASGLIREYSAVAEHLCSVYALAYNQPTLAIAYGKEALRAATSACDGKAYITAALDVAAAYLKVADTLSAQRVVAAARLQGQASGATDLILTLLDLRDAEAFLIAGDFDRALAGVQTVERKLRELHIGRYLPSALRLKAEVYERSGLQMMAVRTIDECLSLTRSMELDHSMGQVKAYFCAARLTRNKRYQSAAHELTSLLKEPPFL